MQLGVENLNDILFPEYEKTCVSEYVKNDENKLIFANSKNELLPKLKLKVVKFLFPIKERRK
jgi:hypothetical protein